MRPAPLILGAELPASVSDEITTAYRQLGEPPVAVRSSATAEDSLTPASPVSKTPTSISAGVTAIYSTPYTTAGPHYGATVQSNTADARECNRMGWRSPSSSKKWWPQTLPGCFHSSSCHRRPGQDAGQRLVRIGRVSGERTRHAGYIRDCASHQGRDSTRDWNQGDAN